MGLFWQPVLYLDAVALARSWAEVLVSNLTQAMWQSVSKCLPKVPETIFF